MLEKEATQKAFHSPKEFIRNLILVDKTDGGEITDKSEEPKCIYPLSTIQDERPTTPYHRYFTGGKFDVKNIFERYILFSVPIDKRQRKYLCFVWEGNLHRFLCLCFGLDEAPLIFTKLLKVPIASLHQLNICMIIYLDDLLIMGCVLQELIFHHNTVIYLLQNLVFVLNLKKSVLEPSQTIKYLEITSYCSGYTASQTSDTVPSKSSN